MRRLGDQDYVLGVGVGIEQIDGGQGRKGAHLAAEIPAADADRLRNAFAGLGEQAADFLETGAGGADQADGAAGYAVGKPQRGAGDNGGASVRTQEQAP